jgi:hypothetical protein
MIGVTFAGAALGFIVGLVAGLAVLLLIRTVAGGSRAVGSTLKVVGQLLAIPGTSLGAPWLGSQLLEGTDLASFLPPYAIALALTTVVVAGYPLAMFVVAVGRQVAPREARGSRA